MKLKFLKDYEGNAGKFSAGDAAEVEGELAYKLIKAKVASTAPKTNNKKAK